MSNCRFLTPCGICEIKSMSSGIPYTCDLMRTGKLEEESRMPVPKFVEDKTYTDTCEADMRGKGYGISYLHHDSITKSDTQI